MKNTISAVIFAYNDEANIRGCIESAKLLTDDVIVIDQGSTDKTADMARDSGASLFHTDRALYVEPVRNFGIEKAKADWVFILDTDERLTQTLAEEVRITVKNSSHTHFKIPRKNIFGRTKWLRHGGWWPDYQIRLIHKPSFKSWPKQIHSTPVIEGSLGFLTKPFLHYFHGDFENMVGKTILFESIESNLLLQAGKPVSTPTFFRKFLGELYRRLIKHLGFLDGQIGIIEAIYQAYSKTITYLYLYEKQV